MAAIEEGAAHCARVLPFELTRKLEGQFRRTLPRRALTHELNVTVNRVNALKLTCEELQEIEIVAAAINMGTNEPCGIDDVPTIAWSRPTLIEELRRLAPVQLQLVEIFAAAIKKSKVFRA